MKHFLIGTGIAVLIAIIAYLADNWSLLYLIAGAVGVICIVFAAILSFTLARKDKGKRNLASERRREQRERSARVLGIILVALPNLLLAVFAFIYFG